MAMVLLMNFDAMEDAHAGPDPAGEVTTPVGLTFTPPAPGRTREERRAGARVRAPALSSRWRPIDRWKLLYMGAWRRTEHTNINETRTAIGLLRHLGRSTRARGCRFLVLIDSMVALGALAKGRSSSPPLLRLCRQQAVLCMAFGLRPLYRYVPSEWNPADGPSRGGPVGVAEETSAAHADRAPATQTLTDPLPDISTGISARLLQLGRSVDGFAGG